MSTSCAKCCLLYREMFRKETGIDPFNKALTIASYCQEVYRTNFLKKDTIAIFNNDRQWKIKQSNGRHVVILHLGERRFIHPTREKWWRENGSSATRWTGIARRPIRPMNFKAVFGTVRIM